MRTIGVHIGILVISLAVGVAFGVVFLLVGVQSAPVIAAVVVPLVSHMLYSEKKIAEKQKWIDNLTRELNEIKQKLGQ